MGDHNIVCSTYSACDSHPHSWPVYFAQTRATIEVALFRGNFSYMTGVLDPTSSVFGYCAAEGFRLMLRCGGIVDRGSTFVSLQNQVLGDLVAVQSSASEELQKKTCCTSTVACVIDTRTDRAPVSRVREHIICIYQVPWYVVYVIPGTRTSTIYDSSLHQAVCQVPGTVRQYRIQQSVCAL